jgi:hypothetical protein
MATQTEIIGDMHKEIARLTAERDHARGHVIEKCAEIEKLTAERDAALEALKPFAHGYWSKQKPSVTVSVVFNHNPYDERPFCTVGDIHRAQILVQRTQDQKIVREAQP